MFSFSNKCVLGIINYLVSTPQLQIHVPRIILSSSTSASLQILRSSQAQSWYNSICQKLHIDLSLNASVASLRSLPVEELISATSFAHSAFGPIWDEITITSDSRKVLFDPELWDEQLQEVVMGVCGNEVGPAFSHRAPDMIASF